MEAYSQLLRTCLAPGQVSRTCKAKTARMSTYPLLPITAVAEQTARLRDLHVFAERWPWECGRAESAAVSFGCVCGMDQTGLQSTRYPSKEDMPTKTPMACLA